MTREDRYSLSMWARTMVGHAEPKDLHAEFMPQHELTFNGLHHEIYLSDPRKTSAVGTRKTILRQPVKAL